MASWTDPTRQFLISAIRDRPVIWDKSYIGESSYRTMKVSSFEEVTQNLNSTYSTKFTWEDVRAQWKNLKDTFVRKLRWVHEGKYVEDAMKEPTWKFYRMLTFLDDKEAKRLGDTCDHSYEMALTSQQQGNCSSGPIIGPRPQHCQQMSYEPTSSEEQMLQMFENKPPNNFQGPQGPQGPMMNSSQNLNSCSPASGMSSSSTSTMVTSSTGSKRDHRYSPVDNGNSNSGVDDELEEDDGQPDRKKPYRSVKMSSMPPMQLITTPPTNQQDEFDHFGGMVAATLRRLSVEQGYMNAMRVQRRLYDALFSVDL
ncbi:hypothetical protein L5515_002370 [Caenorhabditis briggsae]|uniref:MADF domain-containing protein n=2 Tax=Caenorhabditis briggsae TaxID=6238 RepID=A0AAE9E7F6_CAEBR|nr:hypothetical protein L5515_002370 [Caenorhabditis briggsae]